MSRDANCLNVETVFELTIKAGNIIIGVLSVQKLIRLSPSINHRTLNSSTCFSDSVPSSANPSTTRSNHSPITFKDRFRQVAVCFLEQIFKCRCRPTFWRLDGVGIHARVESSHQCNKDGRRHAIDVRCG